MSDYSSAGDVFSPSWWTEHFVGIQNYQDILLHDEKFRKSFNVSIGFIITTVPIRLAVALFVAHILNFKLRGINFFRTAFYLPTVLGGSIAVAVLWRFVFAQQGLVNGLLGTFGFEPVPWFADEHYAIWTIVLLNAWQFGSAMVIFLAALQGVPQSLYEAASIDGASKMQMFLKVTIPLITPVIFFNFIMQMVNASQEFNAPYVITGGGPLHSTYLLSLYIYEESFKNMAMGYGAALAWILFVSISLMTAFAFWSQKYWVFYSGDKRK
jgi:oligogalacturonide transport system permease protein